MPRPRLVLPLVATFLVASPAAAQTPIPDRAAIQAATARRPSADSAAARPFAPAGHWTRGVLRRLALDGVVDAGAASGAWPVAEDIIARLLARAGTPASAADPDSANVASAAAVIGPLAGFTARFAEERTPIANLPLRLAVRGALGIEDRRGALRAGVSVPDAAGYRYTGPAALGDRTDFQGRVEADVGWWRFAGRIAISDVDGPSAADEAYVAAAPGPVQLWLGRRGLSPGATMRGGLVLGDAARFDGIGIETSRPFRLPSFLRALGDVRASQTIARIDRSGDVVRPWFLATRISFAPSPGLAIGLNRAAIFGGEDNVGVTARRVLLMLLGFSDVAGKDSDFENQVASADLYWRAPSEMPVALYGEYGAEDTGFAFVHVPAFIVGLEAAPRRGSALSGALEHVRFARSTRDYPEWYRHGALGGGWTDRGELLGHALGGHGHSTSVEARWHDSPRGWIASLRLSALWRGDENLFAPDREGGAVAAEGALLWFLGERTRLSFGGEVERGGGWTRSIANVGLLVVF